MQDYPNGYPAGFREHENIRTVDFIRDNIPSSVIYAEPLPYTYQIDGGEEKISEFQQELQMYQELKRQAF